MGPIMSFTSLLRTEEEVVRQVEDVGEEEEEQDINQNYLEEEESDDYIDITDSEELEE